VKTSRALVLMCLLLALASAPAAPAVAVPARDRAPEDAGGAAATVALRALRVLHVWDERRATAWAGGDADRLRRLYVPRSRTGRADVGMLRAYAARGLRVVGMRTQLLGVEVLGAGRGRMALLVTDRLVGAVARGRGRPLVLPADRASRARVRLRRVAGRWRVVEVREVLGERAAAR
jgi:hypothetical protein